MQILKCNLRFLLFFLIMVSVNFIHAQNKTIVKGVVLDADTDEPIPYVNITAVNSQASVGTITNEKGYYQIETSVSFDSLKYSYLGYHNAYKNIMSGKEQTVKVKLNPTSLNLNEVIVKEKKEKYRKKDNPAVELMRNVIGMKSQNSMENMDYYQFQKHEKIEIAVANIPDSIEETKSLKKIKFLFENTDRSLLTGQRYLPFYFEEILSHTYYRKEPKSSKVYEDAKKSVEISKFLDTESMDVIMRQIFGNVNIYDKNIDLLANRFMSPIAPLALDFYRFFIIDTLEISGQNCYKVSFLPQNQMDFGFMGSLYVLTDSSYAIKKVELKLTPNTQVNFVNDLLIEQEFIKQDSIWVLDKDIMIVEFSLIGKSFLSFYGQRTNTYNNYQFNIPQNDSIYSGVNKVVRTKDFTEKDENYWTLNRLSGLTEKEEKIYESYKRLDSVTIFKVVRDVTMAIVGGYVEIGWFDLGL